MIILFLFERVLSEVFDKGNPSVTSFIADARNNIIMLLLTIE